jgi:hypothetical protein
MEHLSAHCSALTMEQLFSPCTRYRDIAESQVGCLEFGGNPEGLRELNLDVSTEELLSAKRGFTYTDLYAVLGNDETVVWLTPHAAVMRGSGRANRCCSTILAYRLFINADGKKLFVASSSPAARLEIFSVVGLLLTASASEVYELDIRNLCHPHDVFDIAPTIAYLMEQHHSLKFLSLSGLEIDDDQIRALGVVSRPGLGIKLAFCRISGASAVALAEVLQRNQGPTELMCCDVDNFNLADGLRGNSRLIYLRVLCSSTNEAGNREVLAIMTALRENKGLADLAISLDLTMSDELWGAVCDSLKRLTHPTLQILHFETMDSHRVAPAVTNSRIPVLIRSLVDMLKVNVSVHTIPWYLYPPLDTRNSELFQGSVAPYLETNKFRPRLLAIQKTRPFPHRVKVLGRALLATRTDSNLFWMLLSGNAEILFPSTTTANFPSPKATATSNAAVLPAAVTAASAAAANVARPIACLKRKARP